MNGTLFVGLHSGEERWMIPKLFVHKLNNFDLGVLLYFLVVVGKEALADEEVIDGDWFENRLFHIARTKCIPIDRIKDNYQTLIDMKIIEHRVLNEDELCRINLDVLYPILEGVKL